MDTSNHLNSAKHITHFRNPTQRPAVMGILNVTPDSFSDGGRFQNPDSALRQVEKMIQWGADIIDIGGESTRPGAAAVPVEQEMERVIPMLSAIKQRFAIQVSIDTSKAAIMRAAIQEGADMINDVRALNGDAKALEVCANSTVHVCLMHMQGQPRTMQKNPQYEDVVQTINQFFQERITHCEQAGLTRERLWLDPGFGFGKNLGHNCILLKHLKALTTLGLPLLVGLSRKSMIGTLLGDRPVEQRLHGSVAAAMIAAMNGARIIRVHDVAATVDALKVLHAVNSVEL